MPEQHPSSASLVLAVLARCKMPGHPAEVTISLVTFDDDVPIVCMQRGDWWQYSPLPPALRECLAKVLPAPAPEVSPDSLAHDVKDIAIAARAMASLAALAIEKERARIREPAPPPLPPAIPVEAAPVPTPAVSAPAQPAPLKN